jgi:hypothetical protein
MDARQYFEKWGFWPISGGSPESDDEEFEDADDSDVEDDDDEDDDTSGDDGKKPKKSSKESEKVYTKADVTRLVAERNRRTKRTLMKDPEFRAEVLAAAKEAGETPDVEKLRSKASQVDDLMDIIEQYEDAAEERFTAALETLPEHIQDTAPDDDATPLEKEKWLAKALRAAEKYQSENKDDDKADGDKKERRPRKGLKPRDPKDRTKGDPSRVESLVQEYQKKRPEMYRSMR